MKLTWLAIVFFLGAMPCHAAPKTALVICNYNYQSSQLTNPANDAADIAEKLRYLGFEVFDKFDLNRKQMRNAIRKFGQTLKQKGGAGIFFYAIHCNISGAGGVRNKCSHATFHSSQAFSRGAKAARKRVIATSVQYYDIQGVSCIFKSA